jgi:hypothetical protein
MNSTRALTSLAPLLLVGICSASFPSPARGGEELLRQFDNPQALRQYVRDAIGRQLEEQADQTRYTFRFSEEPEPGVRNLRQSIETGRFTLSRLLAVNGTPVSGERSAAEDERLRQLVERDDLQRILERDEVERAGRIRKLLDAFPDALDFKLSGLESGRDGSELLRLEFRPAEGFHSSGRETAILQASHGILRIDTAEGRLARIDGVVTGDVDFGWGALGRLKRGGRFSLEQSKLPSGRWVLTYLDLELTASALFGLKKIRVHQKESASDFRPVPEHLSLSEAVDLISQPSSVLARFGPIEEL